LLAVFEVMLFLVVFLVLLLPMVVCDLVGFCCCSVSSFHPNFCVIAVEGWRGVVERVVERGGGGERDVERGVERGRCGEGRGGEGRGERGGGGKVERGGMERGGKGWKG
jgi:hypothetical protein